jgi:hypothetical protein
MLVILHILFTVQPPVVASWINWINPLWDGDYFNIEKTDVTFIHTRKPRTRRDKSLGEFRAFIIIFLF